MFEDDALLALGHVAADDLRRDDGAQQVQVEHPAQGIRGQVEEGFVGAGGGIRFVAAGGVDQAIDLAKLGQDLIHGGLTASASSTLACTARARPVPGIRDEGINHFLGCGQVVVQDGHISAALEAAHAPLRPQTRPRRR